MSNECQTRLWGLHPQALEFGLDFRRPRRDDAIQFENAASTALRLSIAPYEESPIRGDIIDGFLWTWRDLFTRARSQSMLRDDLSDFEVAKWMRHVQWLVQIRSDLGRSGRLAFLRKFLLASVQSPKFAGWRELKPWH